MRRLVTALLVGAAAGAGLPSASAGSVPVLVIDGRGFGHGVGMAQDGALFMGRQGATTPQILSHFYPGTTTGRRGGTVRVPVLEGAGGAATIAFPNGGEVRDALGGGQSPGFPVQVPSGGQARVRLDGGRYRVELEPSGRALAPAGGGQLRTASFPSAQATTTTTPVLLPGLLGPLLSTTTTSAPAPPDAGPAPGDPAAEEGGTGGAAGTASSARPLWAVPAGGGVVSLPARDRRYRGAIEVGGGGGQLRLVNQLDVEQYLKGMGEVRDPGWPAASLRAQAVAARTYALRAMAAAGEICETQRCQVYLGAQAEYGAMSRAVDATRGQVLLFARGLASAVYSANGGGTSASVEEGFGTVDVDYPYLRAAAYGTGEPLAWTVTVALSDVRRRVGYRGAVRAVSVSRTGPSGRALEVTIEGDRGARTVTGIAFDAALGLRSTLFTLRTELADSAPPPPEGEDLGQAPPGAPGSDGSVAEAAGDEGAELAALAPGALASAVDRGRAEPGLALGPALFAVLLLVRVAAAVRRAATMGAMGDR